VSYPFAYRQRVRFGETDLQRVVYYANYLVYAEVGRFAYLRELAIGAGLLALTPISPFRPRRWRGALLPRTATVAIEVLGQPSRPVSAAADFTEIRHVARVTIREDHALKATLMFDPEHALEERIIREQFQP
jgi:hypothetical protein